MKLVINRNIFVALFGVVLLFSFSGCKTGDASRTKDVGGASSDVSKPYYVLYLSVPDEMVHYDECPAGTATINRNCTGRRELGSPMPKAKYEEGLRKAILGFRPNQGRISNPTTTEDPAVVNSLEGQIARISQRLSGANLSESEKVELNKQISQLEAQLYTALGNKLRALEEAKVQEILQKINGGDDVVYVEGEVNYNLAALPFRSTMTGRTLAHCGFELTGINVDGKDVLIPLVSAVARDKRGAFNVVSDFFFVNNIIRAHDLYGIKSLKNILTGKEIQIPGGVVTRGIIAVDNFCRNIVIANSEHLLVTPEFSTRKLDINTKLVSISLETGVIGKLHERSFLDASYLFEAARNKLYVTSPRWTKEKAIEILEIDLEAAKSRVLDIYHPNSSWGDLYFQISHVEKGSGAVCSWVRSNKLYDWEKVLVGFASSRQTINGGLGQAYVMPRTNPQGGAIFQDLLSPISVVLWYEYKDFDLGHSFEWHQSKDAYYCFDPDKWQQYYRAKAFHEDYVIPQTGYLDRRKLVYR